MSLSFSEVRNKRSWAKGSITKVATALRFLQSTEIKALREVNIVRQQEALTKGDDVFKAQHQAMYDMEDGMDESQFCDELADHWPPWKVSRTGCKR